MSEHPGIDERLRAALGPDGPLGAPGARRAGDDARGAKARVLAGIRRRRLHRLQAIGAVSVVALGLAIGLPQVFGGHAPATPSSGTVARAAGAGAHGRTSPSRTPVRVVAACRLHGRVTVPCGDLARGSAAQGLSATAASEANAAEFGAAAPAARSLGAPLVVRRGETVVVTLPRLIAHWRWETPRIAGTPVYHGHGPPVVVRAARSRQGAQRFLVKATVPVTAVLEAGEVVFAGPGAAPSIVSGTWPVWALELKVVGT